MNNKCNQGCQASFVTVNSNWDLGGNFCMDGCQPCRNNGRAAKDCMVEQSVPRQTKACAAENRNHTCNENQRSGQCNVRQERNACTGAADCTCEECTAARKLSCRNMNRCVGIVWAKMQEIDTLYDCEHALTAGTLFPELHMPMNGYWPSDAVCADHAQETAFMLWELRLYLDTHPNDREALALFRQMSEKAGDTYANSFLPRECGRWAWVDDPWPWEYQAKCCK